MRQLLFLALWFSCRSISGIEALHELSGSYVPGLPWTTTRPARKTLFSMFRIWFSKNRGQRTGRLYPAAEAVVAGGGLVQPFDPTRNCSKCGCSKVTTVYCDGAGEGGFLASSRPCRKEADKLPVGNERDIYYGEHLHRCCKRCRFVWCEKTLDKCAPLHQLAMAAEDNDEIVEEDPMVLPQFTPSQPLLPPTILPQPSILPQTPISPQPPYWVGDPPPSGFQITCSTNVAGAA